MKKRMKRLLFYMMIGAALTGCGRKETGSELLTGQKEAVEPVTEAVEPLVEETEDGILLATYCGDEDAEQLMRRTVLVEQVDEQTVMDQLCEALGIDGEVKVNRLSFGMHGGDRVAMLDVSQALPDYLNRLGTAGEYIVMGSLTNTFLECYQCDLLMITSEGKVLETSHEIYEEYLEPYPYTEAPYRVKDLVLKEGNLKIVCPQIEGLSNSEIQGKWNRIFLGAEEQTMDAWEADGACEVTYEVKTMTADVLSILMKGRYEGESASYTFKYTYNIDLNTGKSIRLADHVDVSKVAADLFAGKGYYVEESLASFFDERLKTIYESPEALARSLAGYDYAEDGSSPYGYSYLTDGKVWLCMEVPHELGDDIEIELEGF